MARVVLLLQVFHRVPIQPRDAREASDVFYTQGQGDVLLNYENEVIITNASYSEDKKLPYVVPPNNIRVSRLPLGLHIYLLLKGQARRLQRV